MLRECGLWLAGLAGKKIATKEQFQKLLGAAGTSFDGIMKQANAKKRSLWKEANEKEAEAIRLEKLARVRYDESEEAETRGNELDGIIKQLR